MTKSAQQLRNEQIIRELEASLPIDSNRHTGWPVVDEPAALQALLGRGRPFLIGPYYSMSRSARNARMEIDRLMER